MVRFLLIIASVLFLFVSCSENSSEQGISDSEILIGMHTDLSGPASMIGKQSADGANMKFAEFNDAGGAYGRKLNL